jgi:hypothetical protein
VSAFFFLVLGCEKPRERACRALVMQAKNADDARTAATPDARIAANRAHSAARWLRSNAVEDAELEADATALADALDRLADARVRVADATDVLGATDATDLLVRSERVDAYLAAIDSVSKVRRKPCPWYEEHALIEDPRCEAYVTPPSCGLAGPKVTLAQQADHCVRALEGFEQIAAIPSDVTDLASRLRDHASWAKTLPARPVKDTVDRARAVPIMIAERGRADADVTRLVTSLEAKCAR